MPKRRRADGGPSGRAGPGPQSREFDTSVYKAATESRRDNKHINNMVFHDEFFRHRIRSIQCTYRVKLDYWPEKGYSYRIRLLWDHDRLWGTFELGIFNGVFMVDPGPGQDHFQSLDEYLHQHPYNEAQEEDDKEEESEAVKLKNKSEQREYPLEWRGTSLQRPHMNYVSPMAVGKIRFGEYEIWGHFEIMDGIGLPNNRCEFHGKKPFGPTVVSVSIPEVIEEWNDLGVICVEESPRSSTPDANKPKVKTSDTITESSSSASRKWTYSDQKGFLKLVTGIFDITSDAVKEEWELKSKGLTIRFHLDRQGGKMWGNFDVGIVDGYTRMVIPSGGLVHDTPITFQWRGRESETGSPMSGSGEVTFGGNKRIQGIFREMCGDIDFSGKRIQTRGGVSGYDLDYYRRGWEKYKNGGDSDFYSR